MKRVIMLAVLAVVAVSLFAACGGSTTANNTGDSSGSCATWSESPDGAVIDKEVSTGGGCDTGNLLVVPGVPVNYLPGGDPGGEGSQVCSIPNPDPSGSGNGHTIYEGPNGDPNGEAQQVCDALENGG